MNRSYGVFDSFRIQSNILFLEDADFLACENGLAK